MNQFDFAMFGLAVTYPLSLVAVRCCRALLT